MLHFINLQAVCRMLYAITLLSTNPPSILMQCNMHHWLMVQVCCRLAKETVLNVSHDFRTLRSALFYQTNLSENHNWVN